MTRIQVLQANIDELMVRVKELEEMRLRCTCKDEGQPSDGDVDEGIDRAKASGVGVGGEAEAGGSTHAGVHSQAEDMVVSSDSSAQAKENDGAVGVITGKSEDVNEECVADGRDIVRNGEGISSDMAVVVGDGASVQGERPTLVTSCTQTTSREPIRMEGCKVEGVETGTKDTGKGEGQSRVIQSGKWSFVGGSRFWRPMPAKKDVSKQVENEEGAWRMEGSSRVWRRHRKCDQEQEGWRQVKSGVKQNSLVKPPPVRTSNRFSALASLDESGREDVNILVIGDSRVRPLERTFCRRKDKCIVKPGAKIADIDSLIGTVLERNNPEKVVVQVGVNNIGPRASVKIKKEYHSLLQRLRETRKPVFITGVLPRLWATNEWYSRALALNSSVRGMCSDMGLCFIDLWEEFYGCERYYARDGLHLSDEGARVLGACYRLSISGN